MSKENMIDAKGSPLTQGLFLETSYNKTENVIYTLKPRDHKYKGKILPSIKRLFLEFEDPTEYYFAYEYFLDWDHWQRIKANKEIAKHMKGWKDELEVRMAAAGVRSMIDLALDGEKPNYQAAKFLAERSWDKRPAGRPTKAEVEREAKIAAKISDEFSADIARMKR